MDPEQVRAQMSAARQRIDRKLDRLQGRVARSSARERVAFVIGAVISAFFVWGRMRRARARRRAARV